MKIYPVDDDRFVQSLIALKENILSEAFNWEYERVDNAVFGEFMIYCNVCNRDFATTYVAHMRVKEDVNVADVDKILKIDGGLKQ